MVLLLSFKPACNYLNQAVKDISSAEKHLKTILKTSPSPHSILAPPSSPILAESTAAFLPNACLEANTEHCGFHKGRMRSFGTPNSSFNEAIVSCLPINSMSTPTRQTTVKDFPACQCALDFEEDTTETDYSGSGLTRVCASKASESRYRPGIILINVGWSKFL